MFLLGTIWIVNRLGENATPVEIPEPKAPALNAEGYDPSFLISDKEMTAYNSMDAQAIDKFLAQVGYGCRPGKAKEVPATTGINQEYLAQFQSEYEQEQAETNGKDAAGESSKDFTLSSSQQQAVPCLHQAYFDFPGAAADRYCPGTLSELQKVSAGELIASVAKACRINPQVLLVTLQKEQGLITASSTRLTPVKYQIATGFACPDHGTCDERFLGFGEQLYYAAKQFQRYRLDPKLYNYRAGTQVEMALGPDAACPKQELYLSNWATAALYNYTPYLAQAPQVNSQTGTDSSQSGSDRPQPGAGSAQPETEGQTNSNSSETAQDSAKATTDKTTDTQEEASSNSLSEKTPAALPESCNQRGNFNFWGFYKAWFGNPQS